MLTAVSLGHTSGMFIIGDKRPLATRLFGSIGLVEQVLKLRLSQEAPQWLLTCIRKYRAIDKAIAVIIRLDGQTDSGQCEHADRQVCEILPPYNQTQPIV